MTLVAHPLRPIAWDIIEQAIARRLAVKARYHGHERVICPHAIGWKNGRLVTLVYQCSGSTSTGALATNTTQRWRSMLLDDIEDPNIANHFPWQTASNYSTDSISMDTVLLATPALK